MSIPLHTVKKRKRLFDFDTKYFFVIQTHIYVFSKLVLMTKCFKKSVVIFGKGLKIKFLTVKQTSLSAVLYFMKIIFL